eukprot:366305-Chlamydomonas_euryale.AAC.7
MQHLAQCMHAAPGAMHACSTWRNACMQHLAQCMHAAPVAMHACSTCRNACMQHQQRCRVAQFPLSLPPSPPATHVPLMLCAKMLCTKMLCAKMSSGLAVTCLLKTSSELTNQQQLKRASRHSANAKLTPSVTRERTSPPRHCARLHASSWVRSPPS